ncbi:uncharacterized protein LOC124156167 [Ischnura elegans]|uniref:uncharacterized protein LOC124156167 n=1 Tax=Ischnura elegans TaxID=197161 RepID=UPI001ED8A802|nr:uncharacterized protein LOC124156167 [Ischnura elegans]
MSPCKVNWIHALWGSTLVACAAAILTAQSSSNNERVGVGVEATAQGGAPIVPQGAVPFPPNVPPNFPPGLFPGGLLPPGVTVDVSEDAGQSLYQLPGTSSWVSFDVTNWRGYPVRLFFMAADRMGFVKDHRPRSAILPPGRTIRVEVLVVVPYAVGVGAADNITLSAQGPDGISMRSAAITIGQMESDTWRPSCSYTITQSCKDAQDTWKCQSAFWAAEVTVQDDESGLLKISAKPPIGVRYNSFYAGTKEEVKVYLQSSCCEKVIEITAVDLQGNYRVCNVDASTLTTGEIAAIVLGVLLLIALIVVIVIVIVVCRRRRRQTIKL